MSVNKYYIRSKQFVVSFRSYAPRLIALPRVLNLITQTQLRRSSRETNDEFVVAREVGVILAGKHDCGLMKWSVSFVIKLKWIMWYL